MDVKALLRQYNLRPRKSLGQNFLVDEHALSHIVRAADITLDDVVLEIGPGLGSLTLFLSEAARHVIAVEIDRSLISPLRSVLAARSNVSIVEGDILKLDPTELLSPYLTNELPNYKVVANIPYYITSAIIRHLLEADIKPQSIVLTIQQEVAQRIIAQPDDMNLLAVSVQFYGVPRIVQRIPAGAFYPAPDVDSAVVRIDLPDQPRVAVKDVDWFFKVAKAGFGQKRKQLHNSLTAGLPLKHERIMQALSDIEIDPKRRAETLTIEEWGRLSDQLIRDQEILSSESLHPS
jgi:16S rRNA (adenine1518-N6/adenine1519-N6)-dimethyltransferase